MTRALVAAIMAGCEHNRPPEMVCGFPDCVNHRVLRCKYVEQVTLAALRAAFPAEPEPEAIEAMKVAIMECDEQSAWDSIAEADCRKAARAAYRALRALKLGGEG